MVYTKLKDNKITLLLDIFVEQKKIYEIKK
jgi:hypothetical protein